MNEYLQIVSEGRDLSIEEAERAITSIFTDATDAQIGAFLIGIKIKGESIDAPSRRMWQGRLLIPAAQAAMSTTR